MCYWKTTTLSRLRLCMGEIAMTLIMSFTEKREGLGATLGGTNNYRLNMFYLINWLVFNLIDRRASIYKYYWFELNDVVIYKKLIWW